MFKSFSAVLSDHNALASSQTVILHDPVRAKAVNGGLDVFVGSLRLNSLCRGGLYSSRLHDVLGESLGTFNPSCIGVRAEDGEASVAQCVCHTCDQRNLWANNNQIGPNFLGQRNSASGVIHDQWMHGGNFTHTRITRGYVKISSLRVLTHCVQQGVLTGTGANYEDAHSNHLTNQPG